MSKKELIGMKWGMYSRPNREFIYIRKTNRI